jgi:hypothetical protein
VALSADGNTALIGAPRDRIGTGAAWVFTRKHGTWTRQAKLARSGAGSFGDTVSLSANGNTALVSGRGIDGNSAAWVFTRRGSVWSRQTTSPTGGAADFDGRIALSGDGNTALIGIYRKDGSGAVWVYTRSGSKWGRHPTAKLTNGDPTHPAAFGLTLALSADGSTALAGSEDNRSNGVVWAFSRSGSSWTRHTTAGLTGSDATVNAGFGSNFALSANGNTALIGAGFDGNFRGAAWLFNRTGTTWTQETATKLTGSDVSYTFFGNRVALAADRNTALITEPGDGDGGGKGAVWTFANPPIVTSVISKRGRSADGVHVTITGSGLGGASAVHVDHKRAASYTVISPTEITAVAPAGRGAASTEVTVTTSAGSSPPIAVVMSPTASP